MTLLTSTKMPIISDVDATMLACISFSFPNLQSVEILISESSFNGITGVRRRYAILILKWSSVSSRAMPWLVCRLDPGHSDFVTRTVFRMGSKCSSRVTFGKDGRICSLRPQEPVCSSCPDFPFHDNLHNKSSAELSGREMAHKVVLSCLMNQKKYF